MKKKLLMLLLSTSLLFPSQLYTAEEPVFFIEEEEVIEEYTEKDEEEIIKEDAQLLFSLATIPTNELIEDNGVTKNIDDFIVQLTELSRYNLVALNNAEIRCHVRGSVWVGGTLTGAQYVDDGSINGISNTDSYIHNNQSQVYFKSRTNEQGLNSYKQLPGTATSSATSYWENIIKYFPKDGEYFKYVEPNEKGEVDLKYWDYNDSGSDSINEEFPIVYWTDATSVTLGGLAGHVIAPYADIYITYCNHCGSILGKNISTDGESHLNYWTPDIEIETEPIIEETELITELITEPITELVTEPVTEKITEPITELVTERITEPITEPITELITEPVTEEIETETETEPTSSIIITKTLYCNVWHTECDVMGNKAWVKDEISNPEGIRSKEGHRIDHCGAKDSWYVYLDEYGDPYAMMEMKAGSTNDLIPLPAHFYTDETYTEARDPATVEVGERIYWTTENRGEVWHHTGVTRLDIPNFEFIIDGQSYHLKPDETLEVKVPAGTHTIIEKYEKEYIINDVSVPFTVDKNNNAVVSIDVNDGSQVKINFENRPENMPEPPEPETEAPAEEPTEAPTETPTEAPTEEPTETEVQTEEPTEAPTELITEEPTEVPTEAPTELITEQPTEAPTELVTEKPTEIQTEKQTEAPTEKQTEVPTEKPTEKPTELPTISGNKETESLKETEPTKPDKKKPKKSKKEKVKIKVKVETETTQQTEIIRRDTGKTTPIQTGDDTKIALYTLIAIIALAAIIYITIFIYKKRHKN